MDNMIRRSSRSNDVYEDVDGTANNNLSLFSH